jgi:hypothetical protein
MSSVTHTSSQPDHVLIRWSETPNAPSHEELVEIVQVRPSETVVRSAYQIDANTRVYLIKKGYTRIGIVKSCREDQGSFLMEIDVAAIDPLDLVYAVDPGVFGIDEWITEEQENEILKDLDNLENASRVAQGLHDEEGESFQVIADLHRLLQALSAPFLAKIC